MSKCRVFDRLRLCWSTATVSERSVTFRKPNHCVAIKRENVSHVSRVIHCRYCGVDNKVVSDLIGQLCDYCGEALFTGEDEARPKPHRVVADRTGDQRGEPLAEDEPVQ